MCHMKTKTGQYNKAMERTQGYCLYCLGMGRGFRFLKNKHSKFTTLQKKYIISIINKYKLLNTILYLNNNKQ